jgi:hypothetical protein
MKYYIVTNRFIKTVKIFDAVEIENYKSNTPFWFKYTISKNDTVSTATFNIVEDFDSILEAKIWIAENRLASILKEQQIKKNKLYEEKEAQKIQKVLNEYKNKYPEYFL